MPDESVDDVIAEIELGKFGDILTDITIRLNAALRRKDAALLALADDVMSPTVRFLPTLIAARIREIASGS